MRAFLKLLGLPLDVWAMFVTWLPGPVGRFLRFRYWRRRLQHLGEGTRIDVGVYIQQPSSVRIGSGSWIDRHVQILAGRPTGDRATFLEENHDFAFAAGDVVIGDHTHIGPFVVLSGIGGIHIGSNNTVAAGAKVYSFTHHYRNLADPEDRGQYSFTSLARPDQQAMISGPIVMKDHAAIGLNAVVLPGVTIGRGSWIAAGAVLSTDVPDQTLAYGTRVGVPSKSLEHLEIKT